MGKRLRFGTGGFPYTATEPKTTGAIKRLRELGLDHLELEFVQNVFVKPADTAEIKESSLINDVTLSVHGSYFVNLASEDKQKWHAGINRIVQAASVAEQFGGVSVTYHSGFLQGKSAAEVFPLVVQGTGEILSGLQTKGYDQIRISPELTGKPGQYGDLPDLITLVKTVREQFGSQIGLCIDFAHMYARLNGGYNSYDQVCGMLEQIVIELGGEYLDNLHIHLSAIEASPKGEKHHLTCFPTLEQYSDMGIDLPEITPAWDKLGESRNLPNQFKWQEVLRALHTQGVGGFVVCESPILELDALVFQKYYQSL